MRLKSRYLSSKADDTDGQAIEIEVHREEGEYEDSEIEEESVGEESVDNSKEIDQLKRKLPYKQKAIDGKEALKRAEEAREVVYASKDKALIAIQDTIDLHTSILLSSLGKPVEVKY